MLGRTEQDHQLHGALMAKKKAKRKPQLMPAEVARRALSPHALRRWERYGEEPPPKFERKKLKAERRRASRFRAPPLPPGIGIKPTKKKPQPVPVGKYLYTVPTPENIQKFVTRPTGVFDFRYSTPRPWCKTEKMEKGRCAVQLNFDNGQPVLAFCDARERVGEVLPVDDVGSAVLASRTGCEARTPARAVSGLRGLGRGRGRHQSAAEVRNYIKAVRACMKQTRRSKRVCELQVDQRREAAGRRR